MGSRPIAYDGGESVLNVLVHNQLHRVHFYWFYYVKRLKVGGIGASLTLGIVLFACLSQSLHP